ncbi:MAG: tetratricopeptide repeat protein [Thermoanaerobaculia bacterium]
MIQREVVLLVIIAVAAVPLYLFTRRMAEINRHRNSGIAKALYKRAQLQFTEHDPEGAIESLRQAVTNDRDDRRFAFALAKALAEIHHDDEARHALLRLRDAAPEDPSINLQLARLAVRRNDIAEATRYYHHALYGIWTGDQIEKQRRETRTELVRLLIDHGERRRALAELLVMSTETPNEAGLHVELAGLFDEVGDSARALEHFHTAATIEPENFAALRGAGETAFRMGDYRAASLYLAKARLSAPPGESAEVAELLDVARLVESGDPLAARLSRGERVRRLTFALDRVVGRLRSCVAAEQGVGRYGPSLLEKLEGDATAMRSAITVGALRRDPDLVQAGADLVFSIEETAAAWCGEPRGADLALLLIGRKHGRGER